MSNITQKGATGALALQASGAFQTSTDGNLATLVGTRWDLNDGREVILVSASTTTTVTAGQLYQDAAIVASAQNIAVTAFQAYSNNGNIPAVISIGTNATAIVANQYQGGYVMVNSGAGMLGQTLRISENSAVTSATAGTITLEDAPNVTLTTAATLCLLPPHGANVIQMPTTATGAVVGEGLYPIAVSSYGFLTSKGLSAALSDALVASVGQAISPSTTTAGAVTLATAGSAVIGYANQTAVSAQARSVFLNV